VIPTIGRIVLYQTDGRNGYRYSLPAIIVRTRASTDPKAVADGKVRELPDVTTVDLMVFSVDGEKYGENAVPYAEALFGSNGADGSGPVEYGPARSWRWPPKV
jgi:hypothetical protein